MIDIKTDREIEKMREVCKIVALAHEEIRKAIKVGMTTKEIDDITERVFRENGANPSCKGYPTNSKNPFPAASCISVNDEVIHGIPGSRVLKDGDLVSVDIVADKNGFYGDATRSYVVGKGSPDAYNIVEAAEKCFWEGVKMAKVGNRVSDISYAIQQAAEKRGYSIVKEYQGHGIGTHMHEEPGVPNFGKPGKGPRLVAGMTLAIEPMINEGTADVDVLDDGWTVVTYDGKLSAHYENTVYIGKNGPEVLTIL